MKKRVADVVMEVLVQNDIKDCFAVVGGGAMHLNNALVLCDEIDKYFNHHEQACSMAAEAYARLSGKMAAVCVTSGPGGTNAITGVMGAWQDSLPMLVLSGQVRYETTVEASGLPLRVRGTQEFDIIHSVKNMTKYAVMIKEPLSIKRELQKAIDVARSGRRGPVWIDIPLNVQSAWVEEEELEPAVDIECVPEVGEEEIKELFEHIKRAKRPCILAGSGIRSSDVMELFLECIEKLKIPVVGGAWLVDILYTEHPMFYGLSGNIGPRTGNFIIQNADLILVLGNSLSFKQTGFAQEAFAPRAEIVMVDIDPYEAKKPGIRVGQFIHSDLKLFFEKVRSLPYDYEVSKIWKDYCESLKRQFTPFEGIKDLEESERVSAYYLWQVMGELESEESILALGNSSCNSSKLQIGVKKKKQRALTNYTCGSMGYELPAAIGAFVASKKPILCITGDGSIMMNLQELQTIKHYEMPVNLVVFSNEGYGAIRQTCKNFFNNTYVGCTKESGISFPSFEDVAKTFQMAYKCCENNKGVRESLEWIFEKSGGRLLEIKQKLDDPVSPKVMSRLNEEGAFQTPALHDMAPFLSKERIEELMF